MLARVLVVDDEATVALTLRLILEREGYAVDVAASVAEATRQIAAARYDAVLLDMAIGADSGLTVLARLRETAPDSVVIALTGNGTLANATEAIRLGISDYLVKPCRIAELTASLARGLDRRRAILGEQRRLAEERALLLRREQAARAQAEAERRRLDVLATVAAALAEARLDLPAVLDALCRGVVEAIGDSAAALLLSADGKTLEPAAAYEKDPEMLALRREFLTRAPSHVGVGINGRVAHTGEPILLAETSPAELKAALRPEQHPYLDRLPTYSMIAVPLRVHGRVLGTLGSARHTPGRPYTGEDVALLQELADRAALAIDNARLYAAEREAVAAREAFLATAAHELKTPLTSLQGTVQLLIRQVDRGQTPDLEKLRRRLSVVDAQSHRLTKLIGQLLDVARLDAGKLTLERQEGDVGALVAEVVATYRATRDADRIRMRADATAVARVDRLRLEQVVANLLDNALKFSPADRPVDVDVAATDALVTISVTDQGIGIPPNQRDRVFDRFFQAHAAEYLSGLGLGLYVSRQIVEQHGGTIDAEFPETGGTRFVVRLPRGG